MDVTAREAISSAGVASEWRRGWHLVALTAIGITCAPTTLPVYSIGVFVGPFEQAFGWGRGETQTAILFSTGLGVICAPLAGWMVRHLGLRLTILPGLCGLALSLALAGAMTGALWQLYAVYGLMSLLGTGAGAVGWTSLLAQRFDRARGLALGIGLSGTGLCAVLMPQIALQAMLLWGWRGAYFSLSAFILLLVFPLAFMLLPRNAEAAYSDENVHVRALGGQTMEEAIRSRRFWALGVSTACIYLAIGGIIPNLVPALTDKAMSAGDIAAVLSAFGAAIVAGRIAIGALVDRFWAPAVAAAVLIPASIACLILDGSLEPSHAIVAAALLGAAAGMELDVLGFLTARYFGLKDFARIYGRVYIFVAAAAGIAPLAFGHIYDVSRSYHLPFMISAALLIVGAIGLLSLGRYPDVANARTPRHAARA